MSGQESLKTDGFVETGRRNGHLRFELGDRKDEMDYQGIKYVNAQGTIGYIAATAEGQTINFFVSFTAKGQVITVPEIGGEFGNEVMVQNMKLHFVKMGASLKDMFEEHRRCLTTESVQMNRARLDKELDTLPQRVVDMLIAFAKQKGLDKV
jgi:hypothetical protein